MRTISLESVCDIEMGQAPKGTSYNSDGVGYPLLAGAGDFGPDTPSPSKFTNAPTKLSRSKDILLCIRATVGDLNWSDREYCLGRGVAGLRPKNGTLDRKYLWRWLETHRTDLDKKARGSTFKQVSRRDIAELPILVPETIEEQQRIAAILDKADGIRRKREQALNLADELLRAAFLDMFGDPATNPKMLPMAPIKALGNVVTGNTPPRQSPENYGGSIEWIKSDNINTPSHFLTTAEERLSSIGERIARKVPAGSTLVTCIAGSPDCIGNAALADREVAFNQQINAIVPSDCTDRYFLYAQVLTAKALIQRASTNSMKGMVSKGRFQEIEFLAPDKDDQRKFGQVFERIIGTQEAIRNESQEATRLFASLSQRAFRGEI